MAGSVWDLTITSWLTIAAQARGVKEAHQAQQQRMNARRRHG